MNKFFVFLQNIILILISYNGYAITNKTSVAFYYGNTPPAVELHAFEVVVVQPDLSISVKKYNNQSSKLYSYVSVGELEKSSKYSRLATKWKKGENKDWNSDVMDLANPAWRNFLLNKMITPLWKKGYKGFFLDTLDSYQLLRLTKNQKRDQERGLVDLIKQIKSRHPKAKIIINRGFEIIDQVHSEVDAVAAESLFAGWDAKNKRYQPVIKKDRQWLLNALNKIKTNYHLPIIVIDYVSPEQRKKTREIAQKINQQGFIPFVADAHLETLGIGLVEVIPRRILLLYSESQNIAGEPPSIMSVYDYSAFVLQYMGFIPELRLAGPDLPKGVLTDRYAGIITWFNKPIIKHHQAVANWLEQQVKNGLPIIFMQDFGIPKTASLFKRLGLKFEKNAPNIQKVSIDYQSKMTNFEIMPPPLPTDFRAVTSSKKSQVLLSLSADKQKEDAIAITPWGGYVLAPFDIVSLPNEQSRWVINPFAFFQKALRLPKIPIPDVTTVNGRRILTAHIDGDAFVSRVPWLYNQYAGDVIYEQILKRYPIPTTVSLIQREFEIMSASASAEKHLTQVAKKIFALPWIDMATHTYSHPLQWGGLVEGKVMSKRYLSYPSDSYHFNYEKEVLGSSQFINKNFAPPGKKVKTVFWSGDANLKEEPLKIAAENQLKNINGMSKIYINATRSVTNLGALGIQKDNYFHIFAPIPNDFEYTKEWTVPLYRFQNVIHTFQLTEKPYRYKPMSIYYHFYSGVDQGALRALNRIYQWALKQETTPLQIADYIDKVVDFNHTVIARSLNNSVDEWLIANHSSLKEYRIPVSNLRPDLNLSRHVAGYDIHNGNYYIHLTDKRRNWLSLSDNSPSRPYLLDANAELVKWDIINDKTIRFSLKGYVPLRFRLAEMSACLLKHKQQTVKATLNGEYKIKDTQSGQFEIRCEKAGEKDSPSQPIFIWISSTIHTIYQWVTGHFIPRTPVKEIID